MADISFSSDDGTVPSTMMMTIDTSGADEFLQTPVSYHHNNNLLSTCASGSEGSCLGNLKKNQIHNNSGTLTPATLSTVSCSSSSTTSSCTSPYIGNSTVKMINMSTIVSSMKTETEDHLQNNNSATFDGRGEEETSSTNFGSRSFKNQGKQERHDVELQKNKHEQHHLLNHPSLHSQLHTLWVPIPSPSRPRLDPRYAVRLGPSMSTFAHHNIQHQRNPPAVQLQSRTTIVRKSSCASLTSTDGELMPPPTVTRNSGIFRPTPIVPPSVCTDEDFIEQQTFNELRTSIMTEASGPSPLSQLPLQAASQQQRFFSASSSTRSNSSTISDMTGASSSFGPPAVRPPKRAKEDIGVSDRFIPNRATSNFHNFNLWDNVSSLRRRNGIYSGATSSGYGISGIDDGYGGTIRDRDERHSNSNNNNTNNNNTNTNGGTGGTTNNDGGSSSDIATTVGSGGGTSNSLNTVSGASRGLLSTLLRSELLGDNEYPGMMMSNGAGGGGETWNGGAGTSSNRNTPLMEGGNFLRYRSLRQEYQENIFDNALVGGPTAIVNSFSLIPVGSAASQRLMATPPKRKRRISKVPFKVLDAPALQDDFYLNLVDWSSQNVLAVGLGSCVYLWSACTSKVTKLCDLSDSEDIVTSVSWAQRGTHLSVGTNRGEVQLWDTIKCKKVRSMGGHSARVGTLAWTGPILASGSRDRIIYLRDVRVQTPFTDKLTNHKQEVCGLKWSHEEPSFLASGGNDNNLHVIDSRNPSEPLHKFVEHTAAVKAISWSPHQHGLLASGGGTADRCIRFWNTLSGSGLNKIDTGSQVCNLAWSENCNEIVSTHGYSLNQIVVWRYPSMTKVATLTGHTYRVLYLAMSPDGSTIVTGAGDETLRFWQIFPGPRSDGKDTSGVGVLFPHTLGSVIR